MLFKQFVYADVAPLAGAWIETLVVRYLKEDKIVAPLAGAWIETPSFVAFITGPHVAPLAGAWIETPAGLHPAHLATRRTPRGCVD